MKATSGVLCLTLALAAEFAVNSPLRADGPAPPAAAAVPAPTLGGRQFWADILFFHGLHIQRNVWTEHCRLLDENDFRLASGSYEQCRAALDEIKRRRKLPPMRGKAVLLLHGLGRNHTAMESLARRLREHGGYEVFNLTYPSTLGEIAMHAQSLKQIIDHLDGIEEIDLVGHSLGNIVVRHYLGDETDPAHGRQPDGRLRRMVMIGPPNQRAYLALLVADNALFKLVTGASGQQLGSDWDRLEPKLATPRFEFGIIAGGRGDDKGFNSLIPGDNDGIVSVASTRLYGASDFLLVPVAHPLLVRDAQVQDCAIRFLDRGYFRSPQRRQPIGRPGARQ